MTARRRRRQQDQQQPEQEDDGLAQETAYVERATLPVRQHEVASKAFNVLWLDFFRNFSLLAAAASAYWVVTTAVNMQTSTTRVVDEEFTFASLTLIAFLQARNWLSEVNVAHNLAAAAAADGSDESGAMWQSTPFRQFSFATALQTALAVVLTVLQQKQQQNAVLKPIFFFPTALVFYAFAVGAVAYMRHTARSLEAFRKSL